MSALLEIRNARVGYEEREIVHGVSFAIERGQLCALLGLNGSGKTTLIRGICGLLPAEGEVFVDGTSISSWKSRQRAQAVSYIPQVHSTVPGKTVLEVVLMGANPYLGLLETPGKRYEEKALQAMRKLGIETFAERPFQELSQGQKQLVVLARTLVQDTPVMLMDEPDSALDFRNRHMVLEKVREVVKQEGKAGLITLHDPNFAMQYCDRLLLFAKGELIGQIAMEGADREEVRQKLASVYGEVELLAYSGGFLMGRPGR